MNLERQSNKMQYVNFGCWFPTSTTPKKTHKRHFRRYLNMEYLLDDMWNYVHVFKNIIVLWLYRKMSLFSGDAY